MDSSRILSTVKKIKHFFNKVSWLEMAALVALAAFSYYGYVFAHRSNFSTSDVKVLIQGPNSFKAAEEVNFEVIIQNQTKLEIRNIALSVVLPDFIKFKDDDKPEKRIMLETIGARGTFSYSFQVFAAQSAREGKIKTHIEYTPKNLASRFESESEVSVSVGSLPLTVIFDVPEKAVNGQRLEGSFHFVTEEDMVFPLVVKLIAPSGFTLNDADPAAFEDVTWKFEKVLRGESYVVQFTGIISGKQDEIKIFDLVFGTEKEDRGFVEQYRVSRKALISSAPLDFTQVINGKESYVASPGEKLAISIYYKNKSNVDIEDLVITSELVGEIFDIATLDAGLGYFNKNTGAIIWNKNFISSFARLGKDESGGVSFVISLKNNISAKNYKNTGISGISKATIEAMKAPLSLKGLSLRAENSAEVKVRTNLKLFIKGYYYEGPFVNSGPIPPRVGEKTTYTLVWQVANTLNEVNNVRVEAQLPSYVSFGQNISPRTNNVTYNPDSRIILWDMGALGAGVGSSLPVETVAFQVSLTPGEEMRGKTVRLVEQSKIRGTDAFTNESLEFVSGPVDTSLRDDAGIREGDGVVQ